jgi:MtaA/CmuA family methyltransferase
MNGRERVLGLLERRPIDRVPLMPITMMFAADQIGVTYLRYVTDHRALVEGQLRTADRFDLDLVSCISDPAREAADLGAAVSFFDDQPPALVESAALLADKGVLARLQVPDPGSSRRMLDRLQAAALFRREVGEERIIEGWIEGPCALAANLRGINNLMLDFFDDPPFADALLAFATEVGIAFARAQREAGVELMGVGDAVSSLVGPRIFEPVIAPHHVRLVQALRAMGLKTRSHICGDTSAICAARGRLGYDVVDIDSAVPPAFARTQLGPDTVILGNIPTVELMANGTPGQVRDCAAECYRALAPNHIISAGCEVPRTTPIGNMEALTAFAHSLASPVSQVDRSRAPPLS